ncbi:MAG: NB-ARC domain-containing protein, partial [Spirochaetota bacterium]
MLENIPWLLFWGFLKPVFADYLDPEKYVQGALKDLVKGQEKNLFKKVFGRLKKDPRKGDDGIYLYDAFLTSYKHAIERCFYEWQELENVQDTDLIRDQLQVLKRLIEEKKIEELFGSSSLDAESKVIDTILIQGMAADESLQILNDDPLANILREVDKQTEITKKNNQKDKIGEEGKFLSDSIRNNLINYILAGLRKEIQYNDKFYRAVTYDSLVEMKAMLKNLQVPANSVKMLSELESSIQRLEEKIEQNRLSISEEDKEKLNELVVNGFLRFAKMQEEAFVLLSDRVFSEAEGIKIQLEETVGTLGNKIEKEHGETRESIQLIHDDVKEMKEKLKTKPEEESSTSKDTIFNVPIPKNPYFTGRKDVLGKLHKSLQEHKEIAVTSAPKALALSGMGGVGKTQTVAEYAYKYKNEYSAVLWVLADGVDLLRQNFGQLTKELGFKEDKLKEQIETVQYWLRKNKDWLLIFDNAETKGILEEAKNLIPTSGNGHVLFTTRAQATGLIQAVTVDCFDKDTGSIFLLRRSKIVTLDVEEQEVQASVSEKELDLTHTLVRELGGLALAIDQAGAYIEQTDCGIEGYLDRFQQNAVDMLKIRGYEHSKEHPEAVYRTFIIALENVEEKSYLAGEILRDIALLHPDGI